MRKAIYAGSFDPITKGHLWMIEQACKMFDSVVVLISFNPSKSCMFTIDEREQMIIDSLTEHNLLTNVSVKRADMLEERTLTAKYAQSVDAGYLLRGMRTPNDFNYEINMHDVNKSISVEIETIFLIPPHNLRHVSSSTVRELAAFPFGLTRLDEYVTPGILSWVRRKR